MGKGFSKLWQVKEKTETRERQRERRTPERGVGERLCVRRGKELSPLFILFDFSRNGEERLRRRGGDCWKSEGRGDKREEEVEKKPLSLKLASAAAANFLFLLFSLISLAL